MNSSPSTISTIWDHHPAPNSTNPPQPTPLLLFSTSTSWTVNLKKIRYNWHWMLSKTANLKHKNSSFILWCAWNYSPMANSRIQSIASRSGKAANCQNPSTTEESTLSSWILHMDKRSLPLRLLNIRYFAQLLLSAEIVFNIKPCYTGFLLDSEADCGFNLAATVG